MTTSAPSPGPWTVGRLACALGAAAGLAVVLTLGDPGITIDEPLDVRPGRTYVATLRAKGWRFFDRDTVAAVFADNAEHPPLGRWLLGLASTLGEPFAPWLGGPDPFGVHAGRLAPAACFAVLVALVASAAGRRYGPAAGCAAGLSLALMPRVFAHAHLGALDTFLCLFWTAALLAAVRAVESRRPVAAMAGAGAVWALALLTKIHAWLLPPIVLAWALARLRWPKALAAVAAWGMTGLALFFAGWPWLWYDTAARWKAYLGTGVERLTLYTQYFGRVYADREVPWHYPWFYFAVTVPVGLHALGALGMVGGWRRRLRPAGQSGRSSGRIADPSPRPSPRGGEGDRNSPLAEGPARATQADAFPLLLAGAIALFLVLFSTNVPVYDGERLFLVAFPLWAILIGRGFGRAWAWAGGRPWLRRALVAALVAQGYGVATMHPFGLSYYNLLVGGLPGAERLGLELTYWGDAIDPPLLDELARRARAGQGAALAPTLHHAQAAAATTADLLRLGITLRDEAAAPRVDWVLVYRRTAYWKPPLPALTRTPPAALRTRQGVWLSGLWRRAR
jgi:hypothetical protein